MVTGLKNVQRVMVPAKIPVVNVPVQEQLMITITVLANIPT
jgi:hypothetical protein